MELRVSIYDSKSLVWSHRGNAMTLDMKLCETEIFLTAREYGMALAGTLPSSRSTSPRIYCLSIYPVCVKLHRPYPSCLWTSYPSRSWWRVSPYICLETSADYCYCYRRIRWIPGTFILKLWGFRSVTYGAQWSTIQRCLEGLVYSMSVLKAKRMRNQSPSAVLQVDSKSANSGGWNSWMCICVRKLRTASARCYVIDCRLLVFHSSSRGRRWSSFGSGWTFSERLQAKAVISIHTLILAA